MEEWLLWSNARCLIHVQMCCHLSGTGPMLCLCSWLQVSPPSCWHISYCVLLPGCPLTSPSLRHLETGLKMHPTVQCLQGIPQLSCSEGAVLPGSPALSDTAEPGSTMQDGYAASFPECEKWKSWKSSTQTILHVVRGIFASLS